jgi:hypothetical protein
MRACLLHTMRVAKLRAHVGRSSLMAGDPVLELDGILSDARILTLSNEPVDPHQRERAHAVSPEL